LKSYLRDEQPQLTGKRVLIVDDNATNRRILTLQTESWGMIPESVVSGPEALDMFKQGRTFDLAILDMHMPNMDGAMLSVELRDMTGAERLPLVMLTSMATSSRQLAMQYGDLGFAAFLTKPIKPSQLYDVIVGIFSGQKPSKESSTLQSKIDADMAKRLPLRILLAEDNVINQKVAVRILERLGYRADVVGDGIEVLDALKRQSYDVVLMDVQMPKMDGIEATRRICEEWLIGRPRIVAMTANATQNDREACLAAGMDDYVSKPVRIEGLVAALERCGMIAEV
jgi:CheY-like chemotaxis protein